MATKQYIETVLQEISTYQMTFQRDLEGIKTDISDLKYTLLNPEDGVIVSTNKNTEFRTEAQSNEKNYQKQLSELQELKRWKDGVNKALWIIFGTLVAIVARILMMGDTSII